MSNSAFPRWTHLLAIFGIYILASAIFMAIVMLIGSTTGLIASQGDSMTVMPLVQLPVMLSCIWYAYRKAGRPQLLSASSQSLDALTITLAVVGGLLVSLSIGAFAQLLPGYDSLVEMLEGIGTPTIGAALAVVIIAPLLEEILCRGIILRKYLEKASPVKSILISGFFFGMLHLHPIHIVTATVMGFALGYVYYRTRSVYLVIGVHMANNLIAYLGSLYNIEDPAFLTDYGAVGILLTTAVFGILGVGTLRYFGSRLPAPADQTIEEPILNRCVTTYPRGCPGLRSSSASCCWRSGCSASRSSSGRR